MAEKTAKKPKSRAKPAAAKKPKAAAKPKSKPRAKARSTASKPRQKKKPKSNNETFDDMGIIIVDDDLAVDREKINEERRAYLEEARSQEAFD